MSGAELAGYDSGGHGKTLSGFNCRFPGLVVFIIPRSATGVVWFGHRYRGLSGCILLNLEGGKAVTRCGVQGLSKDEASVDSVPAAVV